MTLPVPSPSDDLDRPEAFARAKEELRRRYGALFDTVSALLFRHDPIGISHGPARQYDLEACLILRRLPGLRSAEETSAVVHEVFCECFGSARTAGPRENYSAIAREIWTLWQQHAEKEPDVPPDQMPGAAGSP